MNFEAAIDTRPAVVGFSIRTAKDEYQDCANRLVARCYADKGYVSHKLSDQLTVHTDDAMTVCSAFQGERTVGTIGVRFESDRGLNADAVFGPELAELRSGGLRLCEFTRLAIDPDARDNKAVLARLFHLAYLHAHRLAGCELLVIEVNPRHVAFYRRMLGFQVRSESRLNPRVNAEAVLMTLDLVWACQQIKLYGGQPELAASTRTLFVHFYAAADEALMLAKLRQ
jgi:hypothetical protein